MRNREKGFTLVELLVVIAIIAVLLTFLMPSLKSARDQAKAVVCSSHQKALGRAFLAYAEDYNEWMHYMPNNGLWDNEPFNPAVVEMYDPDHGNAYWGVAYLDYSEGKEVFHCPSQRRVDDWPESSWGQSYQKYFYSCGYGINGMLNYGSGGKKDSNGNPTYSTGDPWKITIFQHPDEVIMCTDHIEQKCDWPTSDMFCRYPGYNMNMNQWRGNGPYGLWGPAEGLDYGIYESFRHKENSNILWLDGHVTKIPETDGMDPFRVYCKWYDPFNISGYKEAGGL